MTSRLGVDLELLLGPVPRPVACATDHPRARPGKASCGLRQGEGAASAASADSEQPRQSLKGTYQVRAWPTSGICHSDLRQWIGRGARVPHARSDPVSGCDGPHARFKRPIRAKREPDQKRRDLNVSAEGGAGRHWSLGAVSN